MYHCSATQAMTGIGMRNTFAYLLHQFCHLCMLAGACEGPASTAQQQCAATRCPDTQHPSLWWMHLALDGDSLATKAMPAPCRYNWLPFMPWSAEWNGAFLYFIGLIMFLIASVSSEITDCPGHEESTTVEVICNQWNHVGSLHPTICATYL